MRGPKDTGPRVNDSITSDKVRLIDHEGENHGVVDINRALDMAADAGLDLVEISPNAEPPVAKVMDYGKFKYEQQKKAAAAKKKQHTQTVKEIKMRPGIDTHDYEVKMRAVRKFLDHGDKVKITIRFRGREMSHQELGREVLNRVQEELADTVKVEARPKMEGRQMMMVVSPKTGA